MPRTLKPAVLLIPGLMLTLLPLPGRTSQAQDPQPITVENLDATEDGAYFSLRENRVIPSDEVTDANWDLRFQGTVISVNGRARLVDRAFDLVERAPEEGYKSDDPSTGPAVPAANHEGWYDYDPTSHLVMPVPDRTIAVMTPDSTYAKVEILSYYENMVPDLGSPRFYTFRFVHQPDGTREFR